MFKPKITLYLCLRLCGVGQTYRPPDVSRRAYFHFLVIRLKTCKITLLCAPWSERLPRRDAKSVFKIPLQENANSIWKVLYGHK